VIAAGGADADESPRRHPEGIGMCDSTTAARPGYSIILPEATVPRAADCLHALRGGTPPGLRRVIGSEP
jgi:hypothetical protein